MKNDEEISRCMMIVEQCKQQMSQLEMQAQYIQAALTDYNKAKITLEKLGELDSETDMIIPIAGGIFIDATAKKAGKSAVKKKAATKKKAAKKTAKKKTSKKKSNVVYDRFCNSWSLR